MENKLCAKCGAEKAVSEFYKSAPSVCKKCKNEQSNAWFAKHPGYAKRKSKAWHRAHPTYQPENTRQWLAAHPGKSAEYIRRYKERKSSSPLGVFVTDDAMAGRWAMYGGKCWVCGGEAKSFDHVKPLSKGGAHTPCNLRPICKSCNAQKHNKWPFIINRATPTFAQDLVGLSIRSLRRKLLSLGASHRRLLSFQACL